DGRTEATALATPQAALNRARPGDIILVTDGTYSVAPGQPPKTPVARFLRAGTPSAWITLKNYPGHRPAFSSHGQNAIEIVQNRKVAPEDAGVLSYLEVRGLRVRGNGDTARADYPAELGTWTPNVHAQGILINGRTGPDSRPRQTDELVHHIRLADNVIEFNTADGIYVEFCDWLFVENNRIENNCWTTPGYAPSGFALMGYANFDAQDNIYKTLIAGNRASGNRLTVKNHPWGVKPRTEFYNGNGFLLDANADKPVKYLGRTLVQNNLAFDNGAGGIQMWGSHRLDLVNNTVALNATVIPWGQVGFEFCRDVRFINNIVVAPPGLPLDSWFLGRADERTAGIVRINNLYWGGAHPNIPGIDDRVADPLFVAPSTDPATADFRLRPGSPAASGGRWELFTPVTDLAGRPRPAHAAPALGAFQP
ncbi:MAG: right-handed parallel beta-helix repeat-containing protein, partial [Burkholderiales bacterium]|nr:right-handed parallel beta-helix repeat-containing protein [Opitutaceae bacterium]